MACLSFDHVSKVNIVPNRAKKIYVGPILRGAKTESSCILSVKWSRRIHRLIAKCISVETSMFVYKEHVFRISHFHLKLPR